MKFIKRPLLITFILGCLSVCFFLGMKHSEGDTFTFVCVDTNEQLIDFLPKMQDAYIEGFAPFKAKQEKKDIEVMKQELVARWKMRSDQIIDYAQDRKVFVHALKNKRNKVIAFALFFETSKPSKVYLYYLVTHPAAQGKGLGKVLVYSAFEKENASIKTVMLSTLKENKKSQGFYNHIGFKEDYRDLTSIHYKLKKTIKGS